MVGRIDVNHAFLRNGGFGPPRFVLNAPFSIYYDGVAGHDTTGLGTLVSPYGTPQKCMDVLASQYDFGGQIVTIQGVGSPSISGSICLLVRTWEGGGTLFINGGGGTFTATGLNGIGIYFNAATPGNVFIVNVTLTCTGPGGQSACILAQSGPQTIVIGGTGAERVFFGACPSGSHIVIGPFCNVQARQGGTFNAGVVNEVYQITGNFVAHVNAQPQASWFMGNTCVAIANGLSCSEFVRAATLSLITISSNTQFPNPAGGANNLTGQKYQVTQLSVLNTGNQGATLPGSQPGFNDGTCSVF